MPELFHLQISLDNDREFIEIDRLLEIVLDPDLYSLHSLLNLARARHDYDIQISMNGLQFFQDCPTVRVKEVKVKKDDIW